MPPASAQSPPTPAGLTDSRVQGSRLPPLAKQAEQRAGGGGTAGHGGIARGKKLAVDGHGSGAGGSGHSRRRGSSPHREGCREKRGGVPRRGRRTAPAPEALPLPLLLRSLPLLLALRPGLFSAFRREQSGCWENKGVGFRYGAATLRFPIAPALFCASSLTTEQEHRPRSNKTPPLRTGYSAASGMLCSATKSRSTQNHARI